MIFAEVASRVGLLGKVNLPRESRADGRAGGRDGGEREKGWEKGRLCTAVGVHVEKSPGELKLRRCLSPFAPNLRSSKGSKADSDSLSHPHLALLFARVVSLARHAAVSKEGIRGRMSKCRASTYFSTLLGLGFGKFALRCEVHRQTPTGGG